MSFLNMGNMISAFSRTSILSKGGVLLIGNMFLSVGLVVTTRVSTELLSPAQLGSVTQMFSMVALFNMALLGPILQYMTRGFHEWYEGGKFIEYSRKYLIYILLITIVSLIMAWVLQSNFHLVNGFSAEWVTLLGGIYILSTAMSALGTTGFNMLNQRIKYVLFSNIPIWFGLGFSFVLFSVYPKTHYWSLGQYAGVSVACVSYFLLMRKAREFYPHQSTINNQKIPFNMYSVFIFAWPLIIINILGWFQYQSYKFVLDKIGGPANVGLFAIGYGLGSGIMMMYEGIFSQYYVPIYYKELKGEGAAGQVKAWNNFASAYIPGVVIVGVFIANNATFLARVMLGEHFRAAAYSLVIWAAIIESIRAVTSMVSHLGFATMDTRIAILPVAVGAVVVPLGVLFFGRINPFWGTAISFFIAYFLVLIVAIIKINRTLPVSWPIRKILLACLLSVPLIVFGQLVKWIQPYPTALLSLSVLICGGIYVLAVQVFMLNYVIHPSRST